MFAVASTDSSYGSKDVEGWELPVLQGLSTALPLLSFEFHLSDENIAKTRRCLVRLQELGPAEVNVTPSERMTPVLRKWMPLTEFADWFPGDLPRLLPGGPYGDIFVRSVPSSDDEHSVAASGA